MLLLLSLTLVAAVGLVHAATYLLWHYERCRSGACSSRVDGADAGAWLTEGLALAAVVVTWPLGLVGSPRVREGAGRVVVLVHGWGLNRASMALIAARLRRDGRIVVSVRFPSRSQNLAAAVGAVADRLRSVAQSSSGGRVDVVAYGVGGVLVRSALREHEAAAYVANLVTLGSPHRGTALALLGLPAPLGELRPGCAFIDALVRGENLPALTHVAAIASPFDAIVFPFDLAYCPGAFNVTVERVGHFSMLYSQRVYTLLAENLDVSPRAAAT